MDDVDRLAFRLVRTIRQHHPHLRDQGFTLADLEERLLPYRESRREMADSGSDAWERTVLRLLAGERSYLAADAELQRAARNALALPSPTLALVRTWSGSMLSLGEAAMQVGTERVSGAFDAARIPQPNAITAPRAVGAAVPIRSTAGNDGTRNVDVKLAKGGSVPCCRFCGGRLPNERRVTFCPHCGIDQTKRQCPACSTELDAAWRFCVTCGRSADLPEVPQILKQAAS